MLQSTPVPDKPPVTRREVVSWAMFDFANSSYTTIIITVAFSVYFTKFVAAGADADWLWGLAIWITNALVLLMAPVIGAIADGSGRKKQFLFLSYVLCVAGTAGLYFAVPGAVPLAMALLVISNVGFVAGENFAGAFLPELSTPDNVGRISAIGWGIGYFGGLASLLLVRPLLAGLNLEPTELTTAANTELFGEVRLAWVVTAAFFAVAAIPTFAFLRERAPRGGEPLWSYVSVGFARLRRTAREVGRFRQLRRFLSVYFVYHAGLTVVIAFAGIIYERTFGFTASELITLFIALQFASAGGAWAFGFIQDRLGSRLTIQLVLMIWVASCVGIFFASNRSHYWGIALLAGIGIGALQTASRALVGLMSPPAKAGEFFGFLGMVSRAAYATGPLIFGRIASATGSHRTAMLTLSLLFVGGLLGMFAVDESEGRRAAEEWVD